MPKNRYKNILPFDHSRVSLEVEQGQEDGDYINANFLNGFNQKNYYIATQVDLSCSMQPLKSDLNLGKQQKPFIYSVYHQPRSQALSSYRPLGRGSFLLARPRGSTMRDPGNEVGLSFECRKVIGFHFLLHDWRKKLAQIFHPIRLVRIRFPVYCVSYNVMTSRFYWFTVSSVSFVTG